MRVEAERLAKLSEAERNVRFWPVELDEPGLVLGLPPATPNPSQGSGLPFGAAAETRAYALVGPQATMTGLAERFLETVIVPLTAKLPADSPFKAVPDRSSLARALAQVCATTVSAQERYVLEWRTGTLFPLPMQRSATGWLVFLDKIQQVPAGNLLVPDPTTVPAGDLVGPTAITPVRDPEREAQPEPPSALTAQVTALIGGKTPEQVATALAHDLLDNPYATCLRVVEALIQLEAHAAADGKKFAAAMVAAMLPPQLSALAATTGGNAVLRRCWARLTSADPMFEPASQALDLVVRTPAQGTTRREYFTPQQRRPAVVPIEPPLTKDQTTVNGHVVGGIALGRRQTYGWTDAFWPGPFAPGVVAVRVFDTAHGAGVPWPTGARPDLIAARRHVVATIGPIEGQIDAVRLADTALLSIGTQQWSFHVDNEGTVLLEHFRRRAPDHYDVFFGMYGLGLAVCDATGRISADEPVVSSQPDREVPADAVRAANPHAFTAGAANAARDYYPTFVTMVQARPGGDPLVLDAPTGKDRRDTPRFDFFGWARSGSKGIGSPVWAARCTIALQSSQALQESELAVAAFRFTRVLDDERVWAADWTTGTPTVKDRKPFKPPVSGLGGARRAAENGLRVAGGCPEAGHTVSQLFPSQYGAALLLDAHINAPNHQKAAIMRAWQRTVDAFLAEATAQLTAETGQAPTADQTLSRAGTLIHVGATEQLSEPFLRRFAVSYASLRGYTESGSRTVVFPDRSFALGFEHDLHLSPLTGTFTGWV
ncbi:hypothetical protein ACWD8I_15695 [Micromonospora arida]|uniref:Uncharacterized protein n=1 Tax=Micromonospora arida TaxID=2203715 RepID=A0A3N9WKY9_9ACTN|nr:hypothetical protein [Micromonospora arida]RQX01625.1 hypothetical protein DLJ58_32385 [Micromonospora arida]